MGLIETYVNLREYNEFEIKAYQLQRNEANECVQALARMVPKKAKIDSIGESTISGRCPSCEHLVIYSKKHDGDSMKSFCRNCGQRIDWS